MNGGEKEDNPLLFIDLVEEAPGADPVAPGRRLVALEAPIVWADVGVLAQLRVHHLSQLVDNGSMAGAGDPA